jgi:hypothetical protein
LIVTDSLSFRSVVFRNNTLGALITPGIAFSTTFSRSITSYFLPVKTEDAGPRSKEIVSSPSVVMSGSGRQVARLLQETPDDRIVAVTFISDEQGRAAEQAIQRLLAFLPQLVRERQQETLKKLIDAFLSDATPHRRLANRPVHASKPEQRH